MLPKIKKVIFVILIILFLAIPLIVFLFDIRYTNEIGELIYNIDNSVIKILCLILSSILPVILCFFFTSFLVGFLYINQFKKKYKGIIKLFVNIFYIIGIILAYTIISYYFSYHSDYSESYRFYCHEICFHGALLCMVNTVPLIVSAIFRIVVVCRAFIKKDKSLYLERN